MNILLIRKKSGAALDVNISRSFTIVLALILLTIPVLSYYLGVISNDRPATLADLNKPEFIDPVRNKLNTIIGSVYKEELAQQQEELDALKQNNQENINALTNTLANLQAHIIRLDALGTRLTEVAKLDKKAFNFDFEPAIGGPMEPGEVLEDIRYRDFVKRLDKVTLEIDNRSKQMEILEKLLISDHFQMATTPTGKPSPDGRISSYFGMRKDPFTGKKRMHKGIDVAARLGAPVVATADGVVVKVEKKPGYGKMLEIDHGYGISTRYGHNKMVSVKVGDFVKQGQIIASMGSTGRSTGPHVHYEVLRNGKQINPGKYIVTAQR